MIDKICTLDDGHNRFKELSNTIYILSRGVKEHHMSQSDQELKNLFVQSPLSTQIEVREIIGSFKRIIDKKKRLTQMRQQAILVSHSKKEQSPVSKKPKYSLPTRRSLQFRNISPPKVVSSSVTPSPKCTISTHLSFFTDAPNTNTTNLIDLSSETKHNNELSFSLKALKNHQKNTKQTFLCFPL